MSQRKIKKRPQPRERAPHTFGIAWYRADQWNRLQEISDDKDELEMTYEAWCEAAKKATETLTQAGVVPRRVDVDVESLLKWCKKEGRPVNAEARSAYVSHILVD